jgi:SMODS and SLOG-associating 2TM effector domain 2
VARKPNVTVSALAAWDLYANTDFAKTLPHIYQHAQEFSLQVRNWYWQSVKRKRTASLIVRVSSIVLLTFGALLPLLAAVFWEDRQKLLCTQMAVAALALAGLLQATDKILGWSSGWLRYVTTVTSIENATRRFELSWASYVLKKAGALAIDDARALFDLADNLEEDIAKAQADETDKWVVEFNSGMSALGDLIKAQRDSADKAVEAARAMINAHRVESDERAKLQASGSIELAIKYKGDTVDVLIAIDDVNEPQFRGLAWAKTGLAPGHHKIAVSCADGSMPGMLKIVDVPAGGVAHLSVDFSA